jgi:hypothetical protein
MSGTTHRTAVSYIDRTREYYHALGYEKPYVWARHTDAAFAPLAKPLAQSRLALVTTASPWCEDQAADGTPPSRKQVWSGSTAAPPARLHTDDLAWDKVTTHTRDVESFLPIRSLQAAVAAGRIGSLATRFHGVPTDYSQRRTIEQDAPEILARCREDEVDIALLIPL